MKARAIAFYLPQYHPIAQNDMFWGKGFTEWTNVTKAKPLFPGHVQPFLPADLGFYDLRVPETREQQALLARSAGIEGFCYWHYWFGNGERALERIFDEVLLSNKPDFPFCLAWANQDWTGKWHGLDNQIIFKQLYPSKDDIERHFYSVLPAFQDHRYLRVDNKPIFMVYRHHDIPSDCPFVATWRELAIREGLDGIYFIGNQGTSPSPHFEFDGYAQNGLSEALDFLQARSPRRPNMIHRLKSKLINKLTFQTAASGPDIYYYSDYAKGMPFELSINCFPTILPCWDNTPRSGRRGMVLDNSSPKLFSCLLGRAIASLSSRPQAQQLIFIKSWNEWAEGNVLEPSQRWGVEYIEAARACLCEEVSNPFQ